MSAATALFSFPNPVNEKVARTVAFFVLLGAILTLSTGWYWLLVPIAYGFLARALTGPTLSPLGRLASQAIAPRLGAARPVAGPPKRFAQCLGTAISVTAAVAALGFGAHTLADVLLAMLVLAAGLESLAGYCLGCKMFALLARVGLIPETVCEECLDITRRVPAEAASGRS